MSWSSSYPPPPRHSRSRSPPRGSYPPRPPHPDSAYPETYRPDWDGYDRDRAWANHERDRMAYDHSRRGRSRSPQPDEGKLHISTSSLQVPTLSLFSWQEATEVNVSVREGQV